MSNILVIIPTYNERETIEEVINTLQNKVFTKIPNHSINILVVDDTSPDKTYLVVKKLMKNQPNLHLLLNKEKSGLGNAYIKGFKYAIKADYDYVVEMDADLQHKPSDLIKMIKEGIDNNYDYVVGSRFIEGGSSKGLNTFKRKFLSGFGILILRISLGLFNYKDITTGFKITKINNILSKIDLDKIHSKSYAYKIQIFYLIHKMKAKIVEIPISFELREKGWSKMDSEDIFESLKVILIIHRDNILSWIKRN